MAAIEVPVYRKGPASGWSPVDPGGMWLFAADHDGSPLTVSVSALLEGPIDIEAMQESLNEALIERPSLTSTIAALGTPPRQRMIWVHRGGPVEIEVMDRRAEGVPTGDPDHWLPNVDLNTDPWMPDLTRETPLRVRISSFSDECHVQTVWGHHTAGDGSFYAMLLLDMSARYHKRVMGSEPEWAWLPSMHAVMNAVPAHQVKPPPWREYLRRLRSLDREYPVDAMGRFKGTPGIPAPLLASRTIGDQEAIVELRRRARTLGGSLTDLTIAATKLATAEWNDARGTPIEVQRQFTAMNLRGRIPGASDDSHGNVATGTIIGSRDSQWTDPAGLAHYVASTRKGFVDGGGYLRGVQMTRGIHRVMSLLTVKRHLELIPKILPESSMAITNLGILFPEIVDGQLTGRPGLQEIGGMRVTASAVLVGTRPSGISALAMASTHSGLNLELSGNQAVCTAEEYGEALDLIISKLLSYAQ
jgi:hypothetical protein